MSTMPWVNACGSQILNPSGTLVWSWDSKDPYGYQAPNELESGTVFTFDLRFPGQRYDKQTGLFHNGFRDYDPKLGRYVQADPIGLEGGWNHYAYTSSNPINYSDFTGLKVVVQEGSRMDAAVKYLRKNSKTYESMYQKINNSPQVYVFVDTLAKENGYGIPYGSNGLPDPSKRMVEVNLTNLDAYCQGKFISSLATIGHETYHAYADDNRMFGGGETPFFEEIEATITEGIIGKEIGVWARGQSGRAWATVQYYMGTTTTSRDKK